MNKTLVERVLLPIGIPLLALVLIELIVVSLSRVLLSTGGTPAVVIALAASLAILAGAALVAASPRLRTSSIVGLLVIAGIAVVVWGVVAAQQGYAPLAHGGEGGEVAHAEMTASDIAFDTDELSFPAGQEVELQLTNEDTVPHNVAIYSDETLGETLFQGELITGPDDVTYQVPALEEGEYFFQCDVHLEMNGTVVVGGEPHE